MSKSPSAFEGLHHVWEGSSRTCRTYDQPCHDNSQGYLACHDNSQGYLAIDWRSAMHQKRLLAYGVNAGMSTLQRYAGMCQLTHTRCVPCQRAGTMPYSCQHPNDDSKLDNLLLFTMMWCV
jgi:hypothetical protein